MSTNNLAPYKGILTVRFHCLTLGNNFLIMHSVLL